LSIEGASVPLLPGEEGRQAGSACVSTAPCRSIFGHPTALPPHGRQADLLGRQPRGRGGRSARRASPDTSPPPSEPPCPTRQARRIGKLRPSASASTTSGLLSPTRRTPPTPSGSPLRLRGDPGGGPLARFMAKNHTGANRLLAPCLLEGRRQSGRLPWV